MTDKNGSKQLTTAAKAQPGKVQPAQQPNMEPPMATCTVQVNLTPEQKTVIQQMANKLGLSMGAYIRMTVLAKVNGLDGNITPG